MKRLEKVIVIKPFNGDEPDIQFEDVNIGGPY